MELIPEAVVKILFSVLIGGLIGAEREFRDKAAGFRTIIFICTGATLFTILSQEIGGIEDPVRIASSVVSGVGFLGAGAIMSGKEGVMGLTTAATIWLAAALGMGVGGGYYATIAAATTIILVVLVLFPTLETWIDDIRETRRYEITSSVEPNIYEELQTIFNAAGVHAHPHKQMKSAGNMISTWNTSGSPQKHEELVKRLFSHEDVKEFRY